MNFKKNRPASELLLAAALILFAVPALVTSPQTAHATLPYSRKENKKCYYCHVDWQNDKHALTAQGQYYFENNFSLEGLPGELVEGPHPPPEHEEGEKKGMPIGVMAGMLVFVAMIALVVVSIFKAPVKKPAAGNDAPGDTATDSGESKPPNAGE